MAIYFARAGSDGLVKIGFAVSVARRLSHLQAGNPETLVLVREIPGTRTTEAWLHHEFATLRHRGEWFTFSPAMMTIEPPVEAMRPATVVRGSHADLLSLWPTSQALADDLGLNVRCVVAWRQRSRIPGWYWLKVVGAAALRGFGTQVTVETLASGLGASIITRKAA